MICTAYVTTEATLCVCMCVYVHIDEDAYFPETWKPKGYWIRQDKLPQTSHVVGEYQTQHLMPCQALYWPSSWGWLHKMISSIPKRKINKNWVTLLIPKHSTPCITENVINYFKQVNSICCTDHTFTPCVSCQEISPGQQQKESGLFQVLLLSLPVPQTKKDLILTVDNILHTRCLP